MKYAALHVHSVFSVKDAIAKPEEYVRRIHEYNNCQSNHEIVGLAITEHGNCFSSILHHIACNEPNKETKKTIKAIYGNEIYHTKVLQDSDIIDYDDMNHLVLLAKNQVGLQNLFDITTHSGMNKKKTSTKSKEYQVTDEVFIRKHGKGLIALSACIGGKLAKLIIAGEYDKAKAWALKMNNVFDEFYLEIQPHDTLPEQMLVNDFLIKMSKETGLKLVMTTDSHYVYKEDKKYHNLMKIIDHNNEFTVDVHLWTPDELIEWCNKYNVPLEAIENTALIADSCNVDIAPKDNKGLMPDFSCPYGYTENSYIIKLANEGLKKKFINNKDIKNLKEYITRLSYELDIITQMGFSGYFLILWDWFKWCKENKIPLGPGRGSAAGSLVAYCLDITKVDPIQNGLIFERFLNPSRLDDPDVDTDISKTHRAQAIKYLMDKYGEAYVCQIATFGEYKLKNTIKAVLSADRGFDADFQNSITKQIPDKLGEFLSVSYSLIEDIVNEPDKYITTDKISDKDYAVAVSTYNMLQNVFEKNPEVKDAIEHLSGAIASVGIHAGGVVISRKPIDNHIPMMKGSDSAVLPVCQTNMDGIHFLRGLV